MARDLCPVFQPTWEEFNDFETYIQYVESQSGPSGMAKIIPPKGFKARKRGYKNIDINISHPVRQEVVGFAGVYEVLLVSEKPMNFKSYKKYAESRDHNTENLDPDQVEKNVSSI